MTNEPFKLISDGMEALGLNYAFERWKDEPKYPYFTGEYLEEESTSEDGMQQCDFILTGWHRGSWLDLETAKEKIENLVLLIDYNKVQLDGTEDQIMPLEPLKEKLEAFGWLVNDEKYDGNNTSDILKSFQWLDSTPNVPKCVIYDTIKGKGVDFSEGKNTWHGAVIDDEHYEIGIKQLRKDKEEKEARL